MTSNNENSALLIRATEDGQAVQDVELHFGPDGLLPVVVQEDGTGEVLLVAFMNRQAFELTRQTGQAHFWSRSRQTLWHKGATSGDYLWVQSVRVNCEENSLLLRVKLAGGAACHTGHRSCYYREIDWKL